MSKKLYNATDKGWKAMSEILDREMPVERPRRRALVFWLLVLLLPLAGALAWLTIGRVPAAAPAKKPPLSTPDRPVAQSPAEQAHSPVTIAAPPILAENSNSSADEIGNETATPSRATAPVAANKTNSNAAIAAKKQPGIAQKQIGTTAVANRDLAANSTSNSIGKTTGTAPAATPVAPVANTGTEPAASAARPVAVVANTSTEQAPSTPQAETAAPATTAPAETPAPVAATPRVLPTAEPIAQMQPTTPAQPNIDPLRQKPSALRFGASAGAFSDMSAHFGGATAGVSLDWQANERWGLRSGLAYQYHALQESEQPLTTITTSTYAEATGDNTIFEPNGTTVNLNDLTSPVYVAVSRLHRLEIPVLAYWQPSTKWRVYGGPSVGYTAYTEVADLSFKNSKTFKVQSGTPADNLSSRISDQTTGFDFRLNIGTSFRVGKNLELGVFYQSPVKVATNPDWLAGADFHATPGANPDIELLAKERQTATNGRSVLQFLATVFF
ncbi:MAG: outer membrane beta-barrel protein [Saprospiraceae bacterium]